MHEYLLRVFLVQKTNLCLEMITLLLDWLVQV